ncbi:MAG: serine/threonine protein kinase [Gemmatimonadetes bacterium]|nr:serine/threonine protein kinase [Gemmatimonadota bacterium]
MTSSALPPTQRSSRRSDTPAASARALSTAGLPPDLLRECSSRLGTVALVWGTGWLLAIGTNLILRWTPGGVSVAGGAWPWPGVLVGAVVVFVSVGLFAYTRATGCNTRLSLDVGLLYEVLLALAIAVVQRWTPASGLSWIALLILIHPTIVPNSTGKMLLAGVSAATMDVVGIALAAARGVPLPPAGTLAWMVLPNYAAALVAVMPARMIQHLARQVAEARELGSYELEALLSRGGMGEVYRARHRLIRRPAAVKLIRPDASSHRDMPANVLRARFWREAEAAMSLSSPHTIALYDFGIEPDGTYYYVMELLNGVDLQELVERFGALPAARVSHLLIQVCDSLAEAHACGQVHRDIKPANIYACRVGQEADFVKVLDFGLVKFAARDGDVLQTQPDVALGTPAFMAPETALGSRDVDYRADLYSLGCVAYWLLTGSLVFQGDSPQRMILAHVQAKPAPPSRRTELPIPACLEEIVMACLSKDPAQRPSSAADLTQRLRQCDVGPAWTPAQAWTWWTAHLPEFIPGAEKG